MPSRLPYPLPKPLSRKLSNKTERLFRFKDWKKPVGEPVLIALQFNL